LFELSAASDELHETVVLPIVKLLPEAGKHVLRRLEFTLSITLTENETPPVASPGDVDPKTVLLGQFTTGASASATVTVNEQLLLLPAVS
jgi:hypothetical protein